MKSVSFLLAVLLLVSLITPGVVGAEVKSETKVKLKDLNVTIPYDRSDIELKRSEKGDTVEIKVLDKKSGELLTTYGESVKPDPSQQNTDATLSSGTYTIHTIYEEREDGPAVSRLYTVMRVYSSGSFRQINEILDTYWQEASSGTWEHDNEHSSTISTSGSFPATEIETSGTATVVVETTHSAGGEFSIEFLESVGFSISSSSEGTYFARKSINLGYRYSLY
ncbi:hypothetical protein [Melghiribacillus thermohalophilus]|nr:hypothetical protein [Melghiribacillus thermohalophilus]